MWLKIDRPLSVLVVAAHPDDEVLGCGGLLALLAQKKTSISTLFLAESGTTQGDDPGYHEAVKTHARSAANLLGVQAIYFAGLPDNRMDTVPLLQVVREIEAAKKRTSPDLVLTHHRGDLNVDHRVAFQAVLTAFRPLPDEKPADILAMEAPSSTEWMAGAPEAAFHPNLFFDITPVMEKKVQALMAYREETRPFPHPRSAEYLRVLGQYHACRNGIDGFAEAFEIVRARGSI
jgi:LmbE family N-acetylglucosaminyl deacetylase